MGSSAREARICHLAVGAEPAAAAATGRTIVAAIPSARPPPPLPLAGALQLRLNVRGRAWFWIDRGAMGALTDKWCELCS